MLGIGLVSIILLNSPYSFTYWWNLGDIKYLVQGYAANKEWSQDFNSALYDCLYTSYILCEIEELLLIFQGDTASNCWFSPSLTVAICSVQNSRVHLCGVNFGSLMVRPLEFAHFAPKRSDPNLKRITTVQVLVSIPSPPGALSLFCLGSCHRWFHQVSQLQRPFLCCCLPNPHSQFWPFIRIPDMTFPLGCLIGILYLAYPKLNS